MATQQVKKFINDVESTYAYRKDERRVEIAFIKSDSAHPAHLEIALISDGPDQTITLDIDEVRLIRRLLSRPEVLAELQ